MEGMHELLDVLERERQRAVLATILHVEGSAYRKEGATMLFLEGGRQVGMLSAGCLEADLAARASEFWAEGGSAPRVVAYDMRAEDDLSWGQGAGCNGEIVVVIEPVTERLRAYFAEMRRWLDRGRQVVMVRRVTEEWDVGAWTFLVEGRKAFGEWEGDVSGALGRLSEEGDGSVGSVGGVGNGDRAVRNSGIRELPGFAGKVYVHRVKPRPRLVIFGAGPDVRPLAALAMQVGFAVTVSDWRPAFCAVEHFPHGVELLVGVPAQVLERLAITSQDSVVIMTHNFQRDQEIIRWLVQQDVRYAGVLGPRRRTERLLAGEDIPSWLHAPVGLDIGAEGPEEIAVSVMAELLQAHRRGCR